MFSLITLRSIRRHSKPAGRGIRAEIHLGENLKEELIT
jgi:hypothetical protein